VRLPAGADDVLLRHNPRCSKSRAVKALLEEREIEFTERRYIEDPLTEDELAELEHRLGTPPGAWIRRGEAAYAEAGLSAGASQAELRSAIAVAPILLERPIVVRGARARLGRPPERVLELF
jgi:arsenate reductase